MKDAPQERFYQPTWAVGALFRSVRRIHINHFGIERLEALPSGGIPRHEERRSEGLSSREPKQVSGLRFYAF
jgi:hypothetical protein